VTAYLGTTEFETALETQFDEQTRQVVRLAAELCSIAGITVPAKESDFDALERSVDVAADFASSHGLRCYRRARGEAAPYPFLAVTFDALENNPGQELIALIGHLDVVPPKEEGQFQPYLEGVDLYARGSADMKTVVATFLAWMARYQKTDGPKPPFIALLSCCEENGSAQPHHMQSALAWLRVFGPHPVCRRRRAHGRAGVDETRAKGRTDLPRKPGLALVAGRGPVRWVAAWHQRARCRRAGDRKGEKRGSAAQRSGGAGR
jgi:hypothetical protein